MNRLSAPALRRHLAFWLVSVLLAAGQIGLWHALAHGPGHSLAAAQARSADSHGGFSRPGEVSADAAFGHPAGAVACALLDHLLCGPALTGVATESPSLAPAVEAVRGPIPALRVVVSAPPRARGPPLV